MPDITLCENKECLLRDNCKRGLVYNDNKPNQSFSYFKPNPVYDSWEQLSFYSECDFQIKINDNEQEDYYTYIW